MELKTQALDRVLEALSPTLAAELDRLVQETRDATRQETQAALEQDLLFRIQTAVREAETAVTAAAAVEREGAVAEAKETARKEVGDELEQCRERLAEATTQLEKASADLATLREQLDHWRVFAETQRQLGEASSQPEILSRFLRLAEPFTDGLAVYVAKADGLALWKGRGKPAFPEIISKETTDPESFFKTITVRGKTVAAVCAAPPFKAETLDFLSASLERAIEVFGLRLRAADGK